MNFKKCSAALILPVLVAVLQLFVFAAPSAVTVADTAEITQSAEDNAVLNADGYVVLNIGEKISATNVRYAEIDGKQTVINSNSNIYYVPCGDKDLLVEITEKTGVDTAQAVKTQYFYIDAESKTFTKLNMDSFIRAYDEKSIRTVGFMGIRFKSHILANVKSEDTDFVVDEYGFLIATKDDLGNEELTLDFSKYVKGVGYNKKDGIDIVYDSLNDEYDIFTGVLKNVPVEHYKTELVCKTYTKLTVNGNQFTVYGEPVIGNVFDTAASLFKDDYENIGISKIVFDYFDGFGTIDDSFAGGFVSCDTEGTQVIVSGSFVSSDSEAESYNVYLVTYDDLGTALSVQKSDDRMLVSGKNIFNADFEIEKTDVQTKAYVITSDVRLIAEEDKISWQPTNEAFYDVLASDAFDAETDFAEYLDQDNSISLIEGISIVSNIHAKYHGRLITEKDDSSYVHIYEMDDASVLVDLSDRNSVNLNGINFSHAEGEIDEDNSYLVGTSVAKSNGGYDPQVVINGLMLEARNYNKITVRMKIESVNGGTTNFRNQSVQIFYKTNVDGQLTEAKSASYPLKNVSNVYDWFEFELEMGQKDTWNNFVTGIRFDPFNCNAKFYVDYIKFSKSDSTQSNTWYDKYLDYAHDNGIVALGEFTENEFERELSREEFLEMLVKAIPEQEFTSINESQFAIPDIDKNRKNAEIFLMLYRAGFTLGFDKDGNLNPKESISRSQAASLVNKLFVEENRLKGTVSASWESDDYLNDVEFNTASDANLYAYTRMNDRKISDGNLSFEAGYDSYMYDSTVSIDADKYTKLKVRIKADYVSEPTTNEAKSYEIYFKPDDYKDPITNYHLSEVATDFYLDAAGWYIFELDLCLHPEWEGNINYFRFDPMNAQGSYKIDYIRFIKSEYADYPDQESLLAAGYTETRLMPDEYFENGFYVSRVDQSVQWNAGLQNRKFTDYCSVINPNYDPDADKPFWTIGPWWQGTGDGFEEIDLYESRDTTTDVYTLADIYGVNEIVYNPKLKSISQTLNASKIYNGKPHIADNYQWWPHQLLDTNANYSDYVDKEVNSADADRMFVELDIRMTKFEDKDETNGMQVCSYLAYFYLRPKAQPSHKIWFGLTLFNGANLTAPTNVIPNWSPDSAAHQYMYGMPQAVVYDGIENSFNPKAGVADVSDEWKHIRLDITPHIDRALAWANRDNIFGFEVTKEDMFFDGVNIGFEIHGNFDATFEIKNFNLVSYNKPE